MRLHLRDGSGLHGIITNGGQAVNIIPEITECQFLARGKTSRYSKEIGERSEMRRSRRARDRDQGRLSRWLAATRT